jgi:type II secretion system protein G
MASPRAFTLIELLVVVAIIAILAAIAVPNFLEAQVRAKVARAKADISSITTGIEAYRGDNSGYPPINTHVVTGGYAPELEARHAFLTTPVAYLSRISTDPFGDRVELSIPQSGDAEHRYRTYDFLTFNDPDALETLIFRSDLVVLKGFHDNIRWIVASQGPDGTVGLSTDVGLAYDPTNGTTSPGDIIRTGPGGALVGG